MKIAVYAIAKNETANVAAFMAPLGEADLVVVADTGSTDDTIPLLRAAGAEVHEIDVSPFRFDIARNMALALLPEDIDLCVSIDLDEVAQPGWRAALEVAWRPGVTLLEYDYVRSHHPDGSPDIRFWFRKIHVRHGYRWQHPVHEVLVPTIPEVVARCPMRVDHYPDGAKSRALYLPLLEQTVAERPDSDQHAFWLGREYSWYERWGDAIAELNRYLALPSAIWDPERAAAMKTLAAAHDALGQPAEAERWRLRACAEAPREREPWVDLAEAYHAAGNWAGGFFAARQALAITERPTHYIVTLNAWEERPDDLAAICAWNLGLHDAARDHVANAARLAPNDQRIAANARLMGATESTATPAMFTPAPPRPPDHAAPAPTPVPVPVPTATSTPEPWRHLYAITIDAYYQGEIEAGRTASEQLLSIDGLPADIREQARRNQVFYAPSLAKFVPSAETRPVVFPVPDGWSRFNPSIAAAEDGFRMIVRSANYRVDRVSRFTVDDPDGVIRNTNYLVDLDRALDVRSVVAIADRTDQSNRSSFFTQGFEDCRLFRHTDEWRVLATMRDRSPKGVWQMGVLRLDDGAFHDLRLLSDAATGRHEKNWMPLPSADGMRFVYSCRPTVILGDDATGQLVEEVRHPGPVIAVDCRGGSAAITVDDGFLCVVHERVEFSDGGRSYPHRFVLLDDRWAIGRVSPQFFFQERGVEFCGGLARHGDRLVASFGREDRDSFLTTMRLDEVLATLRPVAEGALTEDVDLGGQERASVVSFASAPAASSAPPVPSDVPTKSSATPPNAAAEPALVPSLAADFAIAPSPTAAPSEPWRLLMDTGIHAYYDGDLDAGREACERLLSLPDVPDDIRRQTRHNQMFYTQRLVELVPSATARRMVHTVPPNWTFHNPTIAAADGGFRMIGRSSNFSMDRMRYTIHAADGFLRTTNYLLDLDADLAVRSVVAIADETEQESIFPFWVTGFEDCRLVRHRGEWRATASARNRNPDGVCQVALLRLVDGAFRDLQLLSDAGAGRHEKNWMPLTIGDDLFFVYSSSPTVILRYDDATETVVEVSRRPGPIIASEFRGGSQVLPIEDGFLFVVHETIEFEDINRVYPHRFVRMDRQFAVTHVSPQFSFLQPGVEYCCGLTRRGDELIAAFGQEERDAYLMTMRLDEVLSILRPTDWGMGDGGWGSVAASADTDDVGDAPPLPFVPISHPPSPIPHPGITPFPLMVVSTTLTGSRRDLIGDALRSVVDWVDACLVIDTGATDDTLDVARAVAGDKLVVRAFPWIDDFAAARNFAFDAAREIGATWAVTLDTDERLDLGGTDVRAILAEASEDGFRVRHEGGTYAKERFFRLPPKGSFAGPTHEAFIANGAVGLLGDLPSARFSEVSKSAEGYQRKFERDVAILRRHTAAHPDDPRWFYYLGDALQGLRRFPEAIEAYRACAALKGWDEEGAWAGYRAAECWIALENHDAAVESCAAGMVRHAGLAELPWLAGYASWYGGRPAQAVAWSRLAIAMGHFRGHGQNVPRIGFRHPPALYEGPYDVLRYALRAIGDDAGAEEAERLYHEAIAAREAALSVP